MNRSRPPVDRAGIPLHLAEYPAGVPIPGRDGKFLYAYTGQSMYPTLLTLDFMEVRPLAGQEPHIGDVILFSTPGAEQSGAKPFHGAEALVVHRVAAVLPGGLRTRGDNNPADDPWLVSMEQVIGRVVAARRGPRRVTLAGGWQGLAILRLQKMLLKLGRGLRRMKAAVLSPQGRLGDRYPRPLSALVLAFLHPRQAVFATPAGPVTRLLAGQTIIGEYSALDRRWRMRVPYRWLIDERGLRWEDQ